MSIFLQFENDWIYLLNIFFLIKTLDKRLSIVKGLEKFLGQVKLYFLDKMYCIENLYYSEASIFRFSRDQRKNGKRTKRDNLTISK